MNNEKKKSPQSWISSCHICPSLFLKPLYIKSLAQRILPSKNRFLGKAKKKSRGGDNVFEFFKVCLRPIYFGSQAFGHVSKYLFFMADKASMKQAFFFSPFQMSFWFLKIVSSCQTQARSRELTGCQVPGLSSPPYQVFRRSLLNILEVRKPIPQTHRCCSPPHRLGAEHHYLCRASVSMAITDGKCCGIIHVQERRQSRRRGRWRLGEGARPESATMMGASGQELGSGGWGVARGW